jgi:hypothetical protein
MRGGSLPLRGEKAAGGLRLQNFMSAFPQPDDVALA